MIEHVKLKQRESETDHMNSESVLPTCTQQPHNESSIDNSTNQLVNKDDSQSMECHSHSLSIDDDVFTTAESHYDSHSPQKLHGA